MSGIPLGHFKPYVPNAATKLGQAYLYAVKDSEGPLLATEANFLRDNPLLWLRALTLYASNMDFLIRQAKTRLKNGAPGHGEPLSPKRAQEVREHRSWSLVQEHKLHKIRSRRAELVVELGFGDIRDAVIIGDIVELLVEILSSVQQEDWGNVEGLARHWITRLTGLDAQDEPEPEPEQPQEMTEAEVMAMFMSHIRGEGRS